jgi:predicted O-methyltransferase YrrM
MAPKDLHLIDINYSQFNNEYIKIAKERVIKHQGDSATTLSRFPDQYFDLIYIDADHSLDGVRRDLQAAKSKVKRGGYLLCNDYTVWSPLEAQSYGVMYAINEFCASERWPVVYFGLHGLGYHDIGLRRP